MHPELLLRTILFLPFAGFLLLILSGKKVDNGAGWIGLCFSLAGLGLTAWLGSGPLSSVSFVWFELKEAFRFGFQVDVLSVRMLLLVLFVASLVQLFSIEYMREEDGRYRYFAFLQLFVGSMLGIVLADNLLILYIFWELVGVSSYLLIGFWYQKKEATAAAKKAFLVNRVGDVGLALGIFGVWHRFGSLDYAVLSAAAPDTYLTVIGLLLFCGTIAKSAQFPLHVWLPDAMEGPTPVSALIHAATMVAAGVFLLARIFPILTPDALAVVATIGAVTMLMGAVYALRQTDIKKTLAYSTVSQLGLMVLAVGVGAPQAALFHLFTHAFFKAGLFLSSGSVIHSLHHAGHGFDAQDVRIMGGLRKKLPVTFWTYTICAAALAGLPLTSGFLSKDEILHEAFTLTAHSWKIIFPVAALVSAGLTAFYMTKQWLQVFWGEWRNPMLGFAHVHESTWLIKTPLVLLAGLSTAFVFSLNPLGEHFSPWVAAGSVAVAAAGFGLAWVRYRGGVVRNEKELPLLDPLYDVFFVAPVLKAARASAWLDRVVIDNAVILSAKAQVVLAHLAGWTDRYLVDGIPTGTAWLSGWIGGMTRRIQGRAAQSYVIVAVLGLAVLLIWWTW
ncbi:MAG: NADH-quinone oxidoreductase subunit L [Siphonobacter aquaeclarae]|nr:NADH-quinone oxidoreductase subunit L [Siphonobacter aquaeclarae]